MIISKTPLRVSLCGGGTDMAYFYEKHGGICVTCAIDKYVYVIVKERFDDLIVLNYTQHEIVHGVPEIRHDLIRESLQYVGVDKGIEITTLADIPSEGSGLGSSSAITVGLLNALFMYIGEPMTPHDLADMACHIEIDKIGSPIGKQDQFACAYGGMRKLDFLKDDETCVSDHGFTKKELLDIGNNLFIHYTGITRKAKDILSQQKDNADRNEKSLMNLKRLAESLDNRLCDRDINFIGEVLRDSWAIKKTLQSSISNELIDKLADYATFGGAAGCKISGAGGGGFLLSYVPPDKQASFKSVMRPYRELPFNIDPYGTRIIFNIA